MSHFSGIGLRVFLIVLSVAQGFGHVKADGVYTVIGPGTLRSNFKYNVAVSVHKTDTPCTIQVGITGPSYNATKSVDLQPMTTQNIEFDVPTLQTGNYNLTAEGVTGIIFKNSTKLNYADYKPSIHVQTDKATYKPGDLVQFRVLLLDENTRPAAGPPVVTILINDGEQNRVKQFKDVEIVRGVYTGQLQLSEQPVLGNWLIEVVASGGGDNGNSFSKTFEVAKYVLPKFDVVIETAKDVAIPDGLLKVTVRSKYTYGKPVKGKVTVSIKPAYHYYGGSDDSLEAQKTVDIDGKGHVEFDFTKDLRLTPELSYVPPLKIFAVVEEALTGNQRNSTTQVNLHTERYRIESIDNTVEYHPGKPVVFKVAVKHVDGSPVQDSKNYVKLFVDPSRSYFGVPNDEEPAKPLEFTEKLDKHGIATFEFTLPLNNNHSFYSVKCQYLETNTYLSSLHRSTPAAETTDILKLTLNTDKPRLGKDISLEVKSKEVIPYFVYTVVGRGNILQMEHVEVPEGRKYHVFKITPSFEMIPKAKVLVHYVFDNELRFDEITINFEKSFENFINIDTPVQVKPGEDVNLTVTTDPDSFVGLLGVDQSVLLLKSGNDFSKNEILDNLNNFDSTTPYMPGYGRYPGETSGLVTLTNAHYPYNSVKMPTETRNGGLGPVGTIPVKGVSGGRQVKATGKVTNDPREHFVENWIFDEIIDEHSSSGQFNVMRKIPDTITSWVITGFSLNSKTGLALTENPAKINVFQPFFISTNLPYAVKRGEVIAVPVIIFNYMEKSLDTEITMDNTDQEYEFTEATNEVVESPIADVKRLKRITVPSNTGRTVSFMIRPRRVGQVTLKISAVTPLAGDAIHQILKVDPEGVTQYKNRAFFVNLKDASKHIETIDINIPAEAVPDSEYIEFSVVGDLLGPTIKNLDKLVRMPYGCGEQNMVNFVPNILVLKYLEAIGKEMPTIAEKSKKYMEVGYQRELTYKHHDGSYSAFGMTDKAGSTWLTAYVMRSFHQAAKYIDIDRKVIDEGLDFLISKQATNGSFPEYGKLFDSAHQNELGLTSFVLLAFLENIEHIPKYQSQIEKGIQFVIDNAAKTDDIYALSIVASVLQLAESPEANKVLTRLEGMAQSKNNRKWWSKDFHQSKGSPNEMPLPPVRSSSNDVEITSYILLALLEKKSPETVLPIIQWLITQRNSNGGFASTQDTVVGLQALIKFAEKTGAGKGEINIHFTSNDDPEADNVVKVKPDNALVLQTHVFPHSTRQVNFTADGQGSALVQLSYRYNLATRDPVADFKVKTSVNSRSPASLVVDVCAEYMADDKKESNMVVMEIALPSGYAIESENFGQIESVDSVKRIETKNSDSTVIIYFDSLKMGEEKCLPIESSKIHAVAKQKPASVTIYDYYEPSRRASEFYEIKSSLCDICENEDCGEGCKNKN